MRNILKTLLFVSLTSLTACGGGGGGGGGGSSFKNSMVFLETSFGGCFGTFISKTSILTTADCVYNSKFIKVHNKNGSEYSPQYFWNSSFRYSGVHNAYCTLDPSNLAIVKIDARFFDATGAEISPLNYSESIEPGRRLPVFGFGYKDDHLDINKVMSKNVTFVSFENNLSVTTAEAQDIQYKSVYGGHVLSSKNAIIGLQVCSGSYAIGKSYAFVDTRHGTNPRFIKSFAPDTILKSQKQNEFDEGIAMASEPLALEGGSEEMPIPLFSEE